MDKQNIGFFSLYDTANPDSYVGALLVTDENGIPLEFKCTHAVKPTVIQKTLYGDKLKPYIAGTLCALPLLKNVNNKPDVLFITLPYILGIRPETEIPTLLIRRAGESINLQSDENETEKQRLESDSGTFQAIIVQAHRTYSEESKTLNGKINQLFNNFDLIEPFERMKKSIEILGNNDNKFK